MKLAPLIWRLREQGVSHFLVNTGQHFDPEMADNFFQEFDIKPDYNLRPQNTSVVEQLGEIMVGLQKIFFQEKPDLVVVVGDVNSTLAGALVANKMGIALAHIEAGLRSYNYEMPEEHNRRLTDSLADILFTTSEEGEENLRREGVRGKVFFVGNLMIDTLANFAKKVNGVSGDYFFCTLHRAENVDNEKNFNSILEALAVISQDAKTYLPLHPRTKKMAAKFGLLPKIEKIFTLLPPLGYSDSIAYQKSAKLVLTDSGGVQEETSFLGVPCLTLRTETERPITVEKGTNTLAGVDTDGILAAYAKKKIDKKKTSIPLWDGQAAERIVQILLG
jgi:UDP-N-acetylglucosamine 2-epimerase (non-hydrolysing)